MAGRNGSINEKVQCLVCFTPKIQLEVLMAPQIIRLIFWQLGSKGISNGSVIKLQKPQAGPSLMFNM